MDNGESFHSALVFSSKSGLGGAMLGMGYGEDFIEKLSENVEE